MKTAMTAVQFKALAAMEMAPLIYSVAGWCHPESGGLDSFSTQTIEAMASRNWCRRGGTGRRLKATITTAGREALASARSSPGRRA